MEDHPSPQALQPFVPGADTDPRLPGRAGLGPIPLDHHPPQVQQEDITVLAVSYKPTAIRLRLGKDGNSRVVGTKWVISSSFPGNPDAFTGDPK